MFQSIYFYILWGLFFICIAPIMVLNCNTIMGKILSIILALMLALGISLIFYHQDERQAERWNEGICECGGTYEFTAAANSAMSTTYYYTCNECGHTEAFKQIMR